MGIKMYGSSTCGTRVNIAHMGRSLGVHSSSFICLVAHLIRQVLGVSIPISGYQMDGSSHAWYPLSLFGAPPRFMEQVKGDVTKHAMMTTVVIHD